MNLRRLFGVLGGLLFALPLVGAWQAASTPPSLKLLTAGLVIVSSVRPLWGLCATAVLLPLARLVALQVGDPFGGEEIGELLLLPWLAGASLRSVISDWPGTRLDAPALVLGLLVVSGAGLGLFAEQQATMWAADYAAALNRHWWNDYFASRDMFSPLHNAMPWIEGLALAVLAARVLGTEPSKWRAVVAALFIGAAANAAFGWRRVIEVALRHDFSIGELGRFLVTQRISTFYADRNAAGSLYAMYAVAAAWIGLKGPRTWRWSLVAAIVVLFALWITGSRTAWAAAVLGVAGAWVFARGVSVRAAAAGAPSAASALGWLVGATLAVVLVAAVMLWDPGRTAQSSSAISADVRGRMARIAGAMIEEHPLFGIGLGKFRQFSRAHITPEFVALFPATARGENAHNNFLQIWAELGIIGLGAFVWLVMTAGRSALAAAGSSPEIRTVVLGLASGALAFLLTCLGGHPLLIPEMLWLFLLVVGMIAGLAVAVTGAGADGGAGFSHPTVGPAKAGPYVRQRTRLAGLLPTSRAAFWTATALAAVIVVSLPFRVQQFRQQADLAGVVIGASPPTDADADQVYRLAGARSWWYVSSAWRRVEIPLRATRDSQPPCLVRVEVDGHAGNTIEALRDGWSTLTLQFSSEPGAHASRRVELQPPSTCHLMVGKFKHWQ